MEFDHAVKNNEHRWDEERPDHDCADPLEHERTFRPARLRASRAVVSHRCVAPSVDDLASAADIAHTDANDFLYYVNASRNYNPAPKLSTISGPVLWINSADDFINPPELGIAEKMVTKMPNAKFILIPISDATRGHGTHTQAIVWKQYLIDFLAQTEKTAEKK